jgi:pimeloyl-ACP methyl ester carboxylesterase
MCFGGHLRAEEAAMAIAKFRGGDLYYQEWGDGIPILLIHPAGATASTWGSVPGELARAGRVIAYDRRGYSRSPGEPVRSIPGHTADAAAILDTLGIPSAVVAGTSVGATIGIDLALRRPDLVRAVIAYESPWRASRRRPTTSSLGALAAMGWLALRGRHADAAESFLRWAYTYRDGGTAWDAFPPEWRRAARENGKAVLADVRIAIGGYPPPKQLATISTPVVCAHGTRSDATMAGIARSLASHIPTASVRGIDGAGHAVAFDAPAGFATVIVEAVGG